MYKKKRKSKKQVKKEGVIVVAGKRKRATAKATIKQGAGKIIINTKPINLLPRTSQLLIREPLEITEKIIPGLIQKVDIKVNVKGGGKEAQIDASRLAITRALVAFTKNKELRNAFIVYDRHLLTADIRRKETRKPGDSKARAKRQKSYR
ncbi:30S ribosomal protein S9 [Candidatus Pacearchaeota archaeon ex4484_26]|nr:MAG: 30S ribosomal protein S9 [Candidatus Pacearchaeota archaeon ex4484_26]